MLILIVEDHPDIRALTADVLQTKGHDVIKAVNGKEALEVLKGIKPQIIVTDLMMPEMNGFRLIVNLRADPDLARIPVVIMSGEIYLHDIADAVLAKGHVQKPASPDDLFEVIDTVSAGVN